MKAPKFNIAICGGGIGGVAMALALSHFAKDKDFKVDIYEAKQNFSEIGAGLTFSLRPWRILRSLGLDKELETLLDYTRLDFPPQQSLEFRKADQASGVTFYDMQVPNGTIPFHRAQFLEVLTRHLDPTMVTSHFSKRLESYTDPKGEGDPIKLFFADGTTALADILIGGDGLHSATRRSMLESVAVELEASGRDESLAQAQKLREYFEPRWSGRATYRGVVLCEKVEELLPNHRAAKRPVMYAGKNKIVVAYPIANKTLINVSPVIFQPDKVGTVYEGKMVEQRSREELFEHYEGWEDEVQVLLKCIETPLLWINKTLDNLPVSVHGRVALIGDAAHAMTPFLGAGAGQAVEDAYILAAILAHPLVTLRTLPQALKVYEEIRLSFANEVQKKSAMAGNVVMFHDQRFAHLAAQKNGDRDWEAGRSVDPGKLWEVGHAYLELCKWAWITDAEEDKDRAIAQLEKRLAHC